jgi:thiamine kinase-like enzyme
MRRVSETAPDRGSAPTADTTIVLQPGARLGPLRLVRELGIGGQGVVYEAVRESDGLVVAAKILRTDVHLSEDQIDRFEREAQAAQRLHHASIVAVHGVVEWQGFSIILQEMVTGGSLDDAIKSRHGQRDRTDAGDCRWAAEMCRRLALALQHAHESHVVHRDIKPGNVLLTPEGEPKITDFGLAKVEDLFGLTQTGDRMGTPNYMSPEQVEAAHGGVDSRTDIYSLAAVLYRMVSRRVPFQADNLSTLFRDILTRAPTPPRKLEPGVPRDLEAVCLKGLQKSPGERYATAKAFAEDLQRFLDGKPTLARPEGAIVRASRSLSHLALSTLAVVALLVPTVWLLVDFVLQRAAESDVGVHSLRLGVVGLAALVLAWPLSVLGLRLSRGQRWTIGVAWLAALGLATLGGWRIVEQKRDQVHRTERDRLLHLVDFEGLGDRRDVDDLADYVSRWESRLEAPDYLLLGRSYLKRLRPAQAEDWAKRLEAASADSPDSHSLMLAVADALGDDTRSAQAASQLWREPRQGEGWTDWSRAGDILADVHRYDDAERAYRVASKRPDADQGRDDLNLKLAQVSAGLCDYKEAGGFLDDYIKWHEEDARAQEVAISIARSTEDWSGANDHLAILKAGEHGTWAAFVHNHFETEKDRILALKRQGSAEDAQRRTDELLAFIDEVAKHPFTDFDVLDWCATRAADLGNLDVPARLCQRLIELKPDSATPQIGLSNVLYLRGKRAIDQGKVEDARNLFQQSTDAARRAIELDPLFFQSYFNLGLAQQYIIAIDKGEENLSVADLRSILEAFQSTLKYNGLQPEALNNAAFAIALMVKQDPSSASIDDAESLVRRAMRLLEREGAGSCTLTQQQLRFRAEAYDTLREIQEIKGDATAALEAARSAVQTLPPDDERVEEFRQHVKRLESAAAGR